MGLSNVPQNHPKSIGWLSSQLFAIENGRVWGVLHPLDKTTILAQTNPGLVNLQFTRTSSRGNLRINWSTEFTNPRLAWSGGCWVESASCRIWLSLSLGIVIPNMVHTNIWHHHINIGSLYPHDFSILDGQNPRNYEFGRCQIAKELILRSFHFFTRHAHVLRESLEVDAVQLWYQRNDVTFWKIQREGEKNVQQFAGGCQTPCYNCNNYWPI